MRVGGIPIPPEHPRGPNRAPSSSSDDDDEEISTTSIEESDSDREVGDVNRADDPKDSNHASTHGGEQPASHEKDARDLPESGLPGKPDVCSPAASNSGLGACGSGPGSGVISPGPLVALVMSF